MGATGSSDNPAGDRLVPLPRRSLDGDDLLRTIAASPTATVDDLLERTDHLLTQLTTDIGHLRRDQEEERRRIERECEEKQAAAKSAIEQLETLAYAARDIAEHKARLDVLHQALAQPMRLDLSVPFPTLVRRIEDELRMARGITGAIRLATIGALLKQATLQVEHMDRLAGAARARLIKETERELHSEGKEARASYEIGMSVVRRDLRALDVALPPSGLAWDDERWDRWDGWDPLSGVSRWIRVGTYYRPELERFRFPALTALPGGPGLALDVATGDRDRAVAAARSLMVRLLAAVPAGLARFTVIDPVALGESAAPFLPLVDGAPEVLDGGVVSRPEDIEARLEALTGHIQTVIQQHLRGEHETLDEHHDAVGEIVEPYRFVVIFDFPTKLTDRARLLLREVIDQGPRCGVHTVVVTAPGAARAHGSRWKAQLAGLDVIRGDKDGYWFESAASGRWVVDLDALPTTALAEPDGTLTLLGRILTTTIQQAREGRRTEVSVRRLYDLTANALMVRTHDDLPDVERVVDVDDPATWWTGSSARGLSVPLGRSGARDPAFLHLDGLAHGGALVVGERGSGVSTLLHTAVAGWSMLYGPEELELYLVDLAPGGGAAFDAYAAAALPHARVVATDASRDFAASVLDALARELARRTILFEPHGGERAGVAGYRDATGRPLSRVVAVLDGADRLFAVDDRLGDRAATLLDTLVREGPAHGIHLVLAAHDVTPITRLGRRTADHLRVRIALAGTDEASRRVLGAGNGMAAACTAEGEAVLARYEGSTDDARGFRAAAFEPHELGVILRDLRRRADARGQTRRPQVFEGAAPARLDDSAVAELAAGADMRPARLRPRLWLGEPDALGPPVEVTLRREPGSNLLMIGRDERFGQGALVAALASALLVHGSELDARVLDLMPLESGFAESVRALGRGRVRLARRRNRDELVAGVLAEIDGRRGRRDFRAQPVLVVVNGLGAGPVGALEAGERPGGAAAVSPDDVADPGLDLVAALERIVRDGPEVGVHALVWADTLSSLTTHLNRATVREFALRVVTQMSADDSALLIDSAQASTLGPNQALLYDEDAARLTPLRPYLLPAAGFAAELGALADGAGRMARVNGMAGTNGPAGEARAVAGDRRGAPGRPGAGAPARPRTLTMR